MSEKGREGSKAGMAVGKAGPLELMPFHLDLTESQLQKASDALSRAEEALHRASDRGLLCHDHMACQLEPWKAFVHRLERAHGAWRKLAGHLEKSDLSKAMEVFSTELCPCMQNLEALGTLLEAWAKAEQNLDGCEQDIAQGRWDQAEARLQKLQDAYAKDLTRQAPLLPAQADRFAKERATLLEKELAVVRAARKREQDLLNSYNALKAGDFDEASKLLDEAESVDQEATTGLPQVVWDLTSQCYQLAKVLKELRGLFHDLGQTALGIDPKTGLPPEEETLASEQRRLEELRRSIDEARKPLGIIEQRWKEAAPHIIQEAESTREERQRLLTGLKAYRDCARKVQDLVKADRWPQAQNALMTFLVSDDGEQFFNVEEGHGPALPLVKAVATGAQLEVDLAGCRGLERKLFYLRQRERELSHPLLSKMRAERERLEGPQRAKFLRLLVSARGILELEKDQAKLELARWLSVAPVRDDRVLENLEQCVTRLEPAGEQDEKARKSIAPGRGTAQMAEAAGPNWATVLAGAGEVDDIARLIRDRQLPPHFLAIAVVNRLKQAPDDAHDEELVAATLGAWALLAGCKAYRDHMRREFPDLFSRLALDLNRDEWTLSQDVEKEVQRMFEGLEGGWGDITDATSRANLWTVELQAVQEVGKLHAGEDGPDGWPLGPGLGAFCRMPGQLRRRIAAVGQARVWYGPCAPAAAMLRKRKAEKALEALRQVSGDGLIGPMAQSVYNCLDSPENALETDRLRLSRKALEQLLDQALDPNADADTRASLADWANKYATSLLHLVPAPQAVAKLEPLLGRMVEQIKSPEKHLRRRAEVEDAQIRLSAMNAIIEALGNELPAGSLRNLRATRARMLTSSAELRFESWRQTNAKREMDNMLRELDQAVKDAEGTPFSRRARVWRAQLRWTWAHHSGKDELQQKVLGEIATLAQLASQEHWPPLDFRLVRELEGMATSTQPHSLWLTGLTAKSVMRS